MSAPDADTSSPDGEVWLVYRWRHREPPYEPLVRAKRIDNSIFPTVNSTGLAACRQGQFYFAAAPPEGAIVTPSEEVVEVSKPRRTGSKRGARAGQLESQLAKPAYKRPTLKALRKRRRNGLKVISAFSSSGGSSTGYVAAGYEVLAAVEFIPEAAASYRANHPRTALLEKDIREVTAPELLAAAGLEKGELDIFDGSPPCEPFSMAGQRESTWGKENAYSGTTQRSDDLFFEYARLVRGMQPRAFVAENVKGLVTGVAKGYFNEILKELKACGYRVAARVLDAQWLGVPQHRERVIFVGIRNDLEVDPVFPTPLPHRYTVRDALPHLGRVATDPNYDKRRREGLTAEDRMVSSDKPHPTVTTVPGSFSGKSTMIGIVEDGEVEDERLVHTVDHGQFSEQGDVTDDVAPTIQARRQQGATLPVELAVEGRIVSPRGGTEFSEREQSIDEPSPTITGGRDNGSGQTDGILVEESEGRVLYDDGRTPETSGVRERPLDVTDEVAPTVTVGGSDASHNVGANKAHWTVEEEVWDEQTAGNEAFEPKFGPLDAPHTTVMASGARTSGELRSSKTKRRRRLTIDELKAICGFPPDYVLTGSFAQQWERLGDAVPPPMMEQIAKAVEPLLVEAKR